MSLLKGRGRFLPTQRHARTATEFPATREPRRRAHVDAFASRLRHPSGCLPAVCLRASQLFGLSACSPITSCTGSANASKTKKTRLPNARHRLEIHPPNQENRNPSVKRSECLREDTLGFMRVCGRPCETWVERICHPE
jgi:hypothetical protein